MYIYIAIMYVYIEYNAYYIHNIYHTHRYTRVMYAYIIYTYVYAHICIHVCTCTHKNIYFFNPSQWRIKNVALIRGGRHHPRLPVWKSGEGTVPVSARVCDTKRL